jgi:hypothetical protein
MRPSILLAREEREHQENERRERLATGRAPG